MDVKPPQGWRPKNDILSPEPSQVLPGTVLPPVSPTGDAVQTAQTVSSTPSAQGASQESASALSRKKRQYLTRPWRIIASLALALVMIGGSVVAWYLWALAPKNDDATRRPVTIQTGETVDTIAAQLEKEGVIRNAFAFEVYVSLARVGSQLQAGHYRVASSQSVASIVEMLIHPDQKGYSMIILPGMTLKQLADPSVENSLAAQGFSKEEITAALRATYSSPLLKSKPQAASLEGYLYPETYQMATDDTLEQLFERTFDELYQRLEKDGLLAKFAERGLTIHQALTLASIVQKEVSDISVQPQVAQVFEKRLKAGIQLGSDVTFMYAAAQDGVTPSVNYDSPYNTRKYNGLPPGPIANMNYSALQAVATPAEGEYLYFVAGDDGQTYFSRTEAEHLELVRRHCTTLCS